jgi:hypothetical protein
MININNSLWLGYHSHQGDVLYSPKLQLSQKLDTKLQYPNYTHSHHRSLCAGNTDGMELEVQGWDDHAWQEVHLEVHDISSTD